MLPELLGLALTLVVPGIVSASGGVPSPLSPYSILVALPELLTENLLIGLAAPPVLFLLTALLLPSRRRGVSAFSIGFMALAVLATLAWFLLGWSYGVRYQGINHVLLMLALNAGLLMCSALLCRRAVRKGTYAAGLVFIYVTWVWLAWAGFPYLGELP